VETSHVAVEKRMLEAALAPGAHVLEAGCGRGSRLARGGLIAEIVGVDVDAEAGEGNPALDRFVCADLCGRLPFDDAAFDLVYSNFATEHFAEPAAAFAEWRRVLRSGGSVVMLTSNIGNPYLWIAHRLPHAVRVAIKHLGPGVDERDVIPATYRANTPARLERLMRDAGLEPVEIVMVATLHRYAGERRMLAGALRFAEAILPRRARSTIVARFAAVGVGR
jgi:SAM-dependent methyltransferase